MGVHKIFHVYGSTVEVWYFSLVERRFVSCASNSQGFDCFKQLLFPERWESRRFYSSFYQVQLLPHGNISVSIQLCSDWKALGNSYSQACWCYWHNLGHHCHGWQIAAILLTGNQSHSADRVPACLTCGLLPLQNHLGLVNRSALQVFTLLVLSLIKVCCNMSMVPFHGKPPIRESVARRSGTRKAERVREACAGM